MLISKFGRESFEKTGIIKGVGCMLYIRPIKDASVSYSVFLIENYNAKDECLRFDQGRKIYISYEDVENIMGLRHVIT
jgi:hypothetical protein